MILKQVIKYDNAPALEATWCDENENIIKCQAYSADQMDMLAADLGDDAPAYQSLMDEIAAQYIPPAPQPIVVPQVISRRQAKQALLQAGLLDVADAAIAASGDRAAQIDWADAQEFRRDWATLISMQHALGLTDEQIDGLFRLAATL